MVRARVLFISMLGMAILCCAYAIRPQQIPFAKCPYDLLGWLRMAPDTFESTLQKEFKYSDKKIHYGAKGFYGDFDGPDLPPAVLHRIHPDIKDIKFHWEHSNLKEIDITFSKKMPVKYIQQYFSLPRAKGSRNYNYVYGDMRVEQIWYHGESDARTEPPSVDSTDGFGVSGFEHQGPND